MSNKCIQEMEHIKLALDGTLNYVNRPKHHTHTHAHTHKQTHFTLICTRIYIN